MTTEIDGCLFCQKEIQVPSQDHIFPAFLGGTRKIVVCKPCNDYFGHSIEAPAAESLRPIQVVLSSGGVPLGAAPAIWKDACTINGETLDLYVSKSGMAPRLSRPTIYKDENGKLKRAKYRSIKEAKDAMKRLKEKGKLSPTARLEEVVVPETRFEDLEVKMSFRPELLRTVLKMTISVASLLAEFEQSEVYEGRLYLMHDPKSDRVNCVRIDGVNCSVLDAERKPLNHLVYVERTKGRVQGAVQFFGGVQLFCDLGRCDETKQSIGVLASLDPITGEESFVERAAIELSYPRMVTEGELRDVCAERIGQMMKDATTRGAKNLELKMKSVDGGPRPLVNSS